MNNNNKTANKNYTNNKVSNSFCTRLKEEIKIKKKKKNSTEKKVKEN